MASTPPDSLVALLSSDKLRNRVGIWLMPIAWVGQELNESSRLGVAACDLSKFLLDTLPEETRYSGLDAQKVVELLQLVAKRQPGCTLVYNVDLLFTRLKQKERLQVWDQLYNGFPHYPCALLIAVPETAVHVLSLSRVLEKWQEDGRLHGDQSTLDEGK